MPCMKSIPDKGVAILCIYSNKQDTLADWTAYANREKVSIPVLKNVGNRLAAAVGALRRPEVFVLGSSRNVRFLGRIDDPYGVGTSRPGTRDTDLAKALNELLAGKDVSNPETKAVGYFIGRIQPLTRKGDINSNKHIAPILKRSLRRMSSDWPDRSTYAGFRRGKHGLGRNDARSH